MHTETIMSEYSQQLRTVKKFKVQEGQSRRFDCPFCYGYNTLGVSVKRGILEWNCFKASCVAHGIYEEGSLEGLKARLSNIEHDKPILNPVPEFLTSIDSHPNILAWLKKVNSFQAYKDGLIPIKYSPTENRVMFPIFNKGRITGYSGRRMSAYGPKWKKYGDATHLFTCGLGKIGVLVEDAPSACAVAPLPDYIGVSLLGTTLTQQHKQELKSYSKILVCLDPDAASKGFSISARLNGIVPASVRLIPDDLKHFNPEKIKEILENV